jgi:uncharacterized membrane protein
MSRERQLPASKIHASNIDTVVRLEEEQEQRVTRAHRLSAAIGKFAGTPVFAALQVIGVLLWIAVNSGVAEPFTAAFDPFPFPLLSMILALEAVLLASFVLIRQNRMSEMADQRSHLDLQINLLAEREATKVIQLLQRMSEHLGIKDQIMDPEVSELSKDTEVEDVAHDLQENLQNEAEKNRDELPRSAGQPSR